MGGRKMIIAIDMGDGVIVNHDVTQINKGSIEHELIMRIDNYVKIGYEKGTINPVYLHSEKYVYVVAI